MGINHLNNSCQILAFVLLYPSMEAFWNHIVYPAVRRSDRAERSSNETEQLLGQNRQVMKNMAMNESYPFPVLRVYHIYCIV